MVCLTLRTVVSLFGKELPANAVGLLDWNRMDRRRCRVRRRKHLLLLLVLLLVRTFLLCFLQEGGAVVETGGQMRNIYLRLPRILRH